MRMRIRTRRRRNENSFASFLCLLLCLVMIVGVTYAIFTSESNNNIVAGSGKVEVDASIGNIATYSFGVEQTEGAFELGGTASYNEKANVFTIDRMAPGDAVSFDISIENKSNIDASYRIKVAFTGGLRDALIATIILPGSTDAAKLTSDDIATEWATLGNDKIIVPVSIELPYTVGDNYSDMSASIVVTVEAVQANATSLVMISNTKYDTLEEAVAAAKNGDTIFLAGDFVMPNVSGKQLTFAAIKDSFTTIDMSGTGDNHNFTGSKLTFEDLTLNFNDDSSYKGLHHADEEHYKNCTINGQQFLYAPTVSFTGCDFVNYTGYNVWTYGATNVSFTGCTFTTGGRAVLIYNEQTSSSFVANVKLTDCEFISNGAYFAANPEKPKAAVETGSNGGNTETSNKYNITFEGCTVDDNFQANNSNSALWGNKNSMDDEHLLVVIDDVPHTGVDKYVAISNLEMLKAFRDDVNAGNSYAGKIVILTNDIDLGNEEWTPIGTSSKPFSGSFDGQGHTISNLYINKEVGNIASSNRQGLFGTIVPSGATYFKNLTLHNADVTGGYHVGGLIATSDRSDQAANASYANATGNYLIVTNINLTGLVKIYGYEGVGGVMGSGNIAEISNITVNVEKDSYVTTMPDGRTNSFACVGSVKGGGYFAKADNIISNMNVTAKTAGTGGLFGVIGGQNVDCYLSNLSYTGKVTLTESSVDLYGVYSNYQYNGLLVGAPRFSLIADQATCTSTGTLELHTENDVYTSNNMSEAYTWGGDLFGASRDKDFTNKSYAKDYEG